MVSAAKVHILGLVCVTKDIYVALGFVLQKLV